MFMGATDQKFNPIYVKDVVKIANYFLKNKIKGIYNVAGPKTYSRYECLQIIKNQLPKKYKNKTVIVKTKMNNLKFIEKRPLNLALRIKKLQKAYKNTITPIEKIAKNVKKNLMKNILIEDKKAKSKSFFLKQNHNVFDQKLLGFIKKNFKKFKKDLRICMHPNPDANHHDMIILQQRSNSYPPHKHLRKGETYHMIIGKMGCVFFNNNGKVKKMCVLKKEIYLEFQRTPITP